jgi:tetratricopeptide (TPR) repeat protein
MLAVLLSTCAAARVLAQPPQGPPQSEDWRAFTARLDRAVLDEDVAAIKRARADALRFVVAAPSPERAALARYAVAYAGWRLAFNPAVSSNEQNDLLDEAERELEAAIKINPKFAEAMSLLSGVLGAKIAKSPIKGIVLGPRSGGIVDDALALEPENPRVLLSKGIGKLNTPAMFGGSDREAEALLRQALARFAAEPAGQPWPTWGRPDAHAWLGQILAGRGDKAGARVEYEKALALAPNSGWIRYVLMPAVK